MPEGDDAAPDVERLQQEVAHLRKDVDTIRSTMQDMHREVGSAVLLLSRFIGLEWDTSEVVRLAEVKTSSAGVAVDRLSETVGTLEQRLAAAKKSESVGGQGTAGIAECTAVVSVSAAGAGHHAQKPGLLQGDGTSDISALEDAANDLMSSLPSRRQEARKCDGDLMVSQSEKDISSSGDDRDAGRCQPLESEIPHEMSASSPTGRSSLSSESLRSSTPSSSPSPRQVVGERSNRGPSALPSATGNGSSSSNYGAEDGLSVDSGDKRGKPTCDLPRRSCADEHRDTSLSSFRENFPDDRTQHQPPATLLPTLRRSSLGSSSVTQGSLSSNAAAPGAGVVSTSPTSAALGAAGGVANAAPLASPVREEQQADSTDGTSLVAVHRSEEGLLPDSGSEKVATRFSSEGRNLRRARGEVSSAFATLSERVDSEEVCGKRSGGMRDDSEGDASKGGSDEKSKKYPIRPTVGEKSRGGTIAATTPAGERTLSESDTLTTGEGSGVTAVSAVSKVLGSPVAENFTEDGNSGELDRKENANSVGLATTSATDPPRSTAPLKETGAPTEGVAPSSSPRVETLLAAPRDREDESQGGRQKEKEKSASSHMTREEAQQNDTRMAMHTVVSSAESRQGGLATSDAPIDAAASKGEASPLAESITPQKNNFGGQDDGAGERGGDGAEQEVSGLTDGSNFRGSQPSSPETQDRSAFVRASLVGAERDDDDAISAVRPEESGPLEARSTRKASTDYAVGATESDTIPKTSRDGKLRDGGHTESEEPNDTLRTGSASSEEGQDTGVVKGDMPGGVRSTQREENGTVVLRETNEKSEMGHACTDGSRDCGGKSDDSGSSSTDDSSKASEGSSWSSKTRASSGSPSSEKSTPSTARNAPGRKGILRVTDGATDGSDSGRSSGNRKGSDSASKAHFGGKLVAGVDEALSNRTSVEK